MTKITIIENGEPVTKDVGPDTIAGTSKRPAITISKNDGQPTKHFVESQSGGDTASEPADKAVPIPPSRRASKQQAR